jgi:hypothetical protein
MTRITILVLALAACDPQSDDPYRGEPTADLQGVITSQLADPPDNLEPVVLWIPEDERDRSLAARGSVAGASPNSFRIPLFDPPPQAALHDFTLDGDNLLESRIAAALVIAVPPGALQPGTEEPAVWGVAERHVLLYVEQDIQPGTDSEAWVGAPLGAGYHLMDVVRPDQLNCPGQVFDCLRKAEGGFEVQIPVRVDRAERLDAPDFN